MNTIKRREGESLTFNFNYDKDAESVTFTAWDDGGVVLEETVAFVDNVAAFAIQSLDMPVGTYSYGFTINYEGGFTNQLPDTENCDGDDCSFPELIICEGIPEES